MGQDKGFGRMLLARCCLSLIKFLIAIRQPRLKNCINESSFVGFNKKSSLALLNGYILIGRQY